jgi:ectoine hydroxylase-related dioxygenase (phytanoyl-CoA dioxygenase family)
MSLSADQIEQFERQGYLIVNGILTDREVEEFLADQAEVSPHAGLGLRRHTADPGWAHICAHPNVAGTAAQLCGGKPCVVQSMYLPKPGNEAAKGIALHQDAHYLPNDPSTLMACWIAMSDTAADNGGLCVVPGSHLRGLYSTHQSISDDHTNWEQDYQMRDRDGREWTKKFFSFEIDDLDPSQIERLSVKRGSGVFFSGSIIHGSYANTSSRDRLAFAVHYVREGTWLTRRDVQETFPIDEYSRPVK